VEEGVAASRRDAAGEVVQLELEGVRFGWRIAGIVVVVVVVGVVVGSIVVVGIVGSNFLLLVLRHAPSNHILHLEVSIDE